MRQVDHLMWMRDDRGHDETMSPNVSHDDTTDMGTRLVQRQIWKLAIQ